MCSLIFYQAIWHPEQSLWFLQKSNNITVWVCNIKFFSVNHVSQKLNEYYRFICEFFIQIVNSVNRKDNVKVLVASFVLSFIKRRLSCFKGNGKTVFNNACIKIFLPKVYFKVEFFLRRIQQSDQRQPQEAVCSFF